MLIERLFFVTQEGRRNLETSILIILINSRTLTHEDCSVSVREYESQYEATMFGIITVVKLPTCGGQLTQDNVIIS